MIPASSFLLDGDTALVVVEPDGLWLWEGMSEPCDTYPDCKDGRTWPGRDVEEDCPDCDGTGRQTFDIVVAGEWGDPPRPHEVLRVHVINVLRVCDPATGCPGPASPHICWSAMDRRVGSDTDGCWLLVTNTLHDASPSIALPSAAEPGMWLVRLAIHTPENVEEPT